LCDSIMTSFLHQNQILTEKLKQIATKNEYWIFKKEFNK
jgi:hypothetical protein